MTEYFVNYTAQTTLLAGIDASTTTLQIVAVAGSPPTAQLRIRIDNEMMLVTNVAGTTYTVTRGIEGTVGAAHSAGAIVRYILTAAALGGQTDPAAAIPGLRSLGTGALQAAAGNDARFLTSSSTPQFAGLGIGVAGSSGAVNLAATTLLNWNGDTFLVRDAANQLAMRNGANIQSLHVYGSYTDSGNYYHAVVAGDFGSAGPMLRIFGVGTGSGKHLFLSASTSYGGSGAMYVYQSHFSPWIGDINDLGQSNGARWRDLYLGGYTEFTESTDPAAGATNTARLYAKDNGSGKTQLVVRFPTGAVQVLATEP
jgi:hypothetical protein